MWSNSQYVRSFGFYVENGLDGGKSGIRENNSELLIVIQVTDDNSLLVDQGDSHGVSEE